MFYVLLFIILSIAFIISESSSGYYDRGTSNPMLSILAAFLWTLITFAIIKFIKWVSWVEIRRHQQMWGRPQPEPAIKTQTTIHRIKSTEQNKKSEVRKVRKTVNKSDRSK